jgi:hypothetical protein
MDCSYERNEGFNRPRGTSGNLPDDSEDKCYGADYRQDAMHHRLPLQWQMCGRFL